MIDVSINRAIHLARRDKIYIRAKRLLKNPFSGQPLTRRKRVLESLIYLLSEAKSEAESALRGKRGESSEWNMLKFLELLCDAAEAAYAMVQHEDLMEQDRNFLKAFMGSEARRVLKTKVSYRKSADEITRGMKNMVGAVDEAYSRLRIGELDSFSSDDRERYRRAYRVA